MTSGGKSIVFRVTGLPEDQTDDQLAARLRSVIDENLQELERLQIVAKVVLVPSCRNDKETSIALVEFAGGIPQFLSELMKNPLGDWQVEMDDADINFDRHFFGFTQLYATEPGKAVIADIIAITGLDGHAYGSWRGKGNLGRMWLRDFFSKDLPRCRTMVYGYHSKLSSHGIDTILDYGRGFMEEIKKVRYTKELRERPLFFIAHSFGGIILAHCLAKAVQTNEDHHPTVASLYKATYGILFFATPHKGLMVADMEKMLGEQQDHPRQILLDEIDQTSNMLAYQLTDFKNLIRDRKIISFFETEQTRQLEWNSQQQRWSRSGDYITAVTRDSAILELPDTMEDKIPLRADHSQIVKFDSRNAPGYQSALDKLRQFEQDAPAVVAARFSQVRSKPKPSSTVPFARDGNFVGRKEIMRSIDELLSTSGNHHRVALVGIGGIGKSQIAIEYSYRLRDQDPQTWVFWVHANSAARFEQGYREIANMLELPGREDVKNNTLQLVYEGLRSEANGRWLMILDNADDETFLLGQVTDPPSQDHSMTSGTAPLSRFIPQTSHGSVLVTSRNRLAAFKLVGNRHNVIEVNPMDERDALEMLKAKTSVDRSTERDAKRLLQDLGYIPLAISQAAAYINARTMRMTVTKYLAIFWENEANRMKLLNEDSGDLRRDPGVPNAVITTWQISFDQIRQDRPSATELLSLMSVLDPRGIPEFLLSRGYDTVLEFEDALAPLIDFSLVTTEANREAFNMHPLVQLATRKWLTLRGGLEKWQRESVRIISETFPNGEHANWTACEALEPHAQTVLGYNSHDPCYRLEQARILHNSGWYAWARGNYVTAKGRVEESLKIQAALLGPDSPNTLSSLGLLATVLTDQGKYEEAEEMHRRTLTLRETVLGKEHPSTLTSMSNLAEVLSRQGKYEEAEEIHRRTLMLSETVLGKEHPDTLAGMNNLALMLDHQGKYKEAEEILRRTLTLSETVLGKEHPNTLASMNNLALILDHQGEYKEVKEMHRRTLALVETVLGKEHPNTLTSMSNLAEVLSHQGKYEEAEEMLRRTLKLRKTILGAQHPLTLSSMNNLATVLSYQGKIDAVKELYQQSKQGNFPAQ